MMTVNMADVGRQTEWKWVKSRFVIFHVSVYRIVLDGTLFCLNLSLTLLGFKICLVCLFVFFWDHHRDVEFLHWRGLKSHNLKTAPFIMLMLNISLCDFSKYIKFCETVGFFFFFSFSEEILWKFQVAAHQRG